MVTSVTKKLLLAILFVALVALSGFLLPFQDGPPATKTGVQFSYDLNEVPIGATLKGAEFDDDDVTRIAAISSLRWVVLAESRITRRGLDSLSVLKQLKSLDLSRTNLTSDAMDAVVRFSMLRELRLMDCSWLKDEQLASLVVLKNLERLELSSPAITPAGLTHLAQLPELRKLTLGECAAIGDDAVDQLVSLSQLKQLMLSSTEFTTRGYLQLLERLPGVKLSVAVESFKDVREVSKRGTFASNLTGFWQQPNRDETVKPLLPGDLKVIGNLTGLAYLHLHSEITDEMFLELGALPHLNSLFLGHTRITDAGLERLAGFPSLKRLTMFQTEIDGTGLKHLKHTPGLTHLEIRTRQGENVLEHLSPLQELDELLIGAPITDDELSRMPVLAKLRHVWFSDSHVRGPGIEWLSRQPNLISLSFEGGLVDDAAIEPIAKLTSLRYVELRETRMTDVGKARLRELCPNAEFR
jgi:internalin A